MIRQFCVDKSLNLFEGWVCAKILTGAQEQDALHCRVSGVAALLAAELLCDENVAIVSEGFGRDGACVSEACGGNVHQDEASDGSAAEAQE